MWPYLLIWFWSPEQLAPLCSYCSYLPSPCPRQWLTSVWPTWSRWSLIAHPVMKSDSFTTTKRCLNWSCTKIENKPKIKLTQKQKQQESNFSPLLHYVEGTIHKVKILNYWAFFYQLLIRWKKKISHSHKKIWHTILYEIILVKLEHNKTQIITYKWNILETLNVANGLRRAFWLDDAKRQYEQHRKWHANTTSKKHDTDCRRLQTTFTEHK